jgi:hypothetical protein
MPTATTHDVCRQCRTMTRWTCADFRPEGAPWVCEVCGGDPTWRPPPPAYLDPFVWMFLAANLAVLGFVCRVLVALWRR